MFNKNKTDYSRRFLNHQFKKRLEAQRNYKRRARHIPEKQWGVFLSKLGLGSWWSRILTAAVFFLLIYLVYIPNFLFVKQVIISGANTAIIASANETVNSFLQKKLPLPQKNLILLSKNQLEDYLIKNNSKILKVNSINKKFPNKLIISITPRLDEFLLKSPLTTYIISNDGVVTSRFIPDASSSLPSLPILITLNSTADLSLQQQAFSPEKIKFFESISQNLPIVLKSPINDFELTDLQNNSSNVYLKNGLKVLLDLSENPEKALARLEVLFSQLQDSDKQKLYYIDLRSLDKAYICFNQTPCVNNANLPNFQPASTTNIISN